MMLEIIKDLKEKNHQLKRWLKLLQQEAEEASEVCMSIALKSYANNVAHDCELALNGEILEEDCDE